jgi:SEC-C motif-containing protein
MACPCGSGESFDQCCGPILRGDRPADSPQQLMRARYTAYVRHEIDFLHDSTAPAAREQLDRQATENWSRQADWHSLEILGTEGGSGSDDDGTVEFIARYSLQGNPVEHHEIATFERQQGRWYFVDSLEPKQTPYRRAMPKIGPNDPCPCGSGRKYKKCCRQPVA